MTLPNIDEVNITVTRSAGGTWTAIFTHATDARLNATFACEHLTTLVRHIERYLKNMESAS